MEVQSNQYIGRQCKRGHSGLRYSSNSNCVDCQRNKNRALTSEDHHRYYLKYRNSIEGRAAILLRGVSFRQKDHSLTKEWISDRLRIGMCEISGLSFDLTKGVGRTPFSPSIDRIDSAKGYEPENCRMIVWGLNTAFGNWGQETFRKIALAWLSNGAPQ